MWSQVYGVLLIIALIWIIIYKIIHHKEQLKKMSLIQVFGVIILYIIAIGLALGIIFTTGQIVKPMEFQGPLLWIIEILTVIIALSLSGLLLENFLPKIMKQ